MWTAEPNSTHPQQVEYRELPQVHPVYWWLSLFISVRNNNSSNMTALLLEGLYCEPIRKDVALFIPVIKLGCYYYYYYYYCNLVVTRWQ
jgi:hypothetical protein